MWKKKRDKTKQDDKLPGMLVFTIPSSESGARSVPSRIDVSTGVERVIDVSYHTLMTGLKEEKDK